jgi:hypothetical protein
VATSSPVVEATPIEAALLQRLAPAECLPWRADAASERSVEAAVRCEVDTGAPSELTLLSYSDADALRDAWSSQVGGIRPRLESDPGACEGSTTGVRRWGYGRLACDLDEGTAVLYWTDSRSDLLGIVRRPGSDVGTLYAWWADEAKPLGRVADAAADTSVPDAERSPGPGSANGILCTSLPDPIVDPSDRTWRIQRVRFRDGPDSERILFDLERQGRVRSGRGARITLDRMPVSSVTAEVPGAKRPRRGRTALVVRMQGVTDAPDLRAYRPTGVDRVRELSIVRGDRSRTAILSLAGDGCYQVRFPVFGAADDTRAQLILDIPT